MRPCLHGSLPASFAVLAVALSLAAGQLLDVRGQRVVSGSSRREVYRTSYTRETAARARPDELVPELIKINIEKQEQTRAYKTQFNCSL